MKTGKIYFTIDILIIINSMNKKVLLAGMHNTGKTTFIAALWYMLSNFDDDAQIRLGSLEKGEDHYLKLICDCWMSFNPVPRTSQTKTKGEQVVINIKKTSTDESISLDIPDFSGETFKNHFDNREWDTDYVETIKNLDGIILFVNPTDENNKPKLLVLRNEILQNFYGINPTNEGVAFIPYDTSHTSNQVKLVDCLQFIEKYSEIKWPIKLSLVVSLWDKVDEAYEGVINPELWIKQNLPLLFQYLNCNKEIFISNYFGISAQGGDYKDREALAELDPMKRVKVREGDNIHEDISRPILWITE